MRPLDRRVLPHLWPGRTPLALALVGSALGGLLVVAQAFAVALLVTRLLADPAGSGWHPAAVAVLGLLVARAAVSAGVDVAVSAAAVRVGAHLRRVVLRRALDLDSTELARHATGELALLATRGVTAVEPYLTRYLPALVVAAVLPVVTVAAIASQDVLAAVVVVATLPLVPIFAALVGLATRDRAARQWRALEQLSGHFVDVVRGLPTLVAHRRAAKQAPVIRAVTDRYRRTSREVLRLAFASSAVLELVATVSVALVAVVVGLRLADGGLDLQTALTVLLLAPEAYWPLRRVGAEFHAAAEGTATFEAIHELTSGGGADAGDGLPPEPLGLRLEQLSVTWPGAAGPAVHALAAEIPVRGLTAVTGPSGCGKSTLLAALLGEVAPSAGRILLGGVDLAGVDRRAWLARVAFVGQRPWLIDGTVADNVRIGRPGATSAEIVAALDEVGLGLRADLRLGEDGAGLSAGQSARLALARVLVSDRPYVLLDEPTAHLDAETEEVLVQVLRDLARTRCVVVVAHREAVVAAADHVVALPGVRPVRAGRVPQPGREGVLRRTTPTSESVHPPTGRVRGRLAAATVLGILAASSGVALTATAGWLIARSAEHPPVLMLMVAIVGVRTFGLARPVLRYAERLVSHDAALRLLAERRASVYEALLPLVPGRLGKRRGDLLAAVVDDADAVLDDRLRVRLPTWTWLGTVLVAGLVTGWWLPLAGLAVTASALTAGALAWVTARTGAGSHAARAVDARAELSHRVLELLTDARPLVQWGADDAALRRVDRVGERLGRATRGSARWLAAARTWPVLGAGATAAVAALAAPALAEGAVTGPIAALLVLVPLALLDVTAPMADAGALRQSTRAAEQRLAALTGQAPAVVDPADPLPLPSSSGVKLDRVSASWGDRPALRHLSLDLPPGRALGVVGPSGSGKSTLAALMLRSLTPTDGRQQLDGTDVQRLRADDVRSVVGLLDDDPYLFASTLAENVRLARADATDAEVEHALRRAHLGDWLDGLPEGLASRLGDGGTAVSGGERARIGVARLLLAGHRVLVLDEPTAHLDTATARRVAAEILGSRDGRSVVWITHSDVGLEAMDDVLELGREKSLVRPR